MHVKALEKTKFWVPTQAAKEKCKGDYTNFGDMECAQALQGVYQVIYI